MDKADINRQKQFKILLISNGNSNSQKGEEELKNVRKRADGRYEWRKQINGLKYQIINRNKKILESKIKEFKKSISITVSHDGESHKFINLAEEWFSLYKANIASSATYRSCINNHFQIELFKKDIKTLTYMELELFLSKIKAPRVKAYCYFIITGVFKEALKRNYITRDVSALITKPKNESVKGESFTLREQKLILDNLDKSNMKYEILFYLLTGCRREEGCRTKFEHLDLENNKIFIDRTKRNCTKGYVPISEHFKQILQDNFKNMFTRSPDFYTKTFGEYLKFLNIKNHKLHDLRHTFATNIYYLGVPDKERQYYLGHKSIVMTNDIYTHLDLTITKNDILNLYKDLYPNF